MSKKKIPTTSCTNKFSHTQQNFSTIPTKFANTHKNIHAHTTKFCHVHKTKFTHAHKFSHIHHEHIHTSQTQFSQCQYSQNPNQSSSNNITKYLHCQNSNSHQHFPNCTMIKEKTHFKNAPKPTFQTWSITQCPQNFKSDNISPWKTHRGVHMTIWSMGPRVLKKSIISIPVKCWIIFLTLRS